MPKMSLRHGFLLALLLAATFAVYAGSLYGPFVFDDSQAIFQTPQVTLKEPISIHGPRSVLLTTYRVNYLLGQGESFGYHLVNLAFHLANTSLVFLLLAAFGLPSGAALFGAVVFALHPMQSEAVIYISARSELLSTFFALFAFRMALKSNWIRMCLCCILAFYSKESAAMVPFLIGFYFVVTGKLNYRWIALGLIGIILLFMFPMNMLEPAERPWMEHLLLQSTQVVRYFGMILIPVGQTLDHDAEALSPLFGIVALSILALLVCAAWIFRKSQPLWTLGIGMMLIPILPRLAINIPEFIAERHTYLPMVGISLLAGCFYEAILDRTDSRGALSSESETIAPLFT